MPQGRNKSISLMYCKAGEESAVWPLSYVPRSDHGPACLPEGGVNRVSRPGLPPDSSGSEDQVDHKTKTYARPQPRRMPLWLKGILRGQPRPSHNGRVLRKQCGRACTRAPQAEDLKRLEEGPWTRVAGPWGGAGEGGRCRGPDVAEPIARGGEGGTTRMGRAANGVFQHLAL